ncbi:DUF2238 domain-containing protein [Candidatus Woesearchaeota archaeon]|nr:DUF2238 domain-containing protein [Candidatus Woesearchaeota archaeon]
MGLFQNKNYPKWLFVFYILFFALTTINVPHLSDFILEHIMTVIFIVLLLSTYKSFPLSHLSYTFIFIFMIFHTIGAHYTYAEVPYEKWSKALFGTGINEFFGFARNHYDRLVHFSFGLFMAYPVREIFLRIANVKGFWGYYLPLDVMAAFSMVYELIEWGVALIFGGELEMTYLGTQGDIWDAHKDMALAALGALITMAVVAFINYIYKPDFKEEIKSSLSVKKITPIGEIELKRVINRKKKREMKHFRL